MKMENPRFDADKFREACEPAAEPIVLHSRENPPVLTVLCNCGYCRRPL
jgi:hypothetical protein